MSTSPYVGPKPFRESDADVFHARLRETAEIRSLLLARRLLLVYGPSGAGKTSLFDAGLLPLLRGEEVDLLAGGRVGGPGASLAGDSRIRNVLAHSFLASLFPDTPPDELSGATLLEALTRSEQPTDRFGDPVTRVVVLDQAEELFTAWPHRWEERIAFAEQVREALEELPALHLLVGLREEYLAAASALLESAAVQRQGRYHLRPLLPVAAVDAVARPLEGTGRSFAVGVAEHLVDLVRRVEVLDEGLRPVVVVDEFVEPVQLQVTCVRLWESLPPGAAVITHADVDRFGDVDDAMDDYVGEAVAQVAGVSGVPADRILTWLEETFVTDLGTRGTAYEGNSQTRGMPNDVPRALEDRHVLRAEVRARARWYELAHDRLVEVIRRVARDRLLHEDDRLGRQQRAADQLARAEAAYSRGDVDGALRHASEALDGYDALEDAWAAANTLAAFGDFEMARSPELALQHYELAADRFRDLADERALARALAAAGSVLIDAGDAERAKQVVSEATAVDPSSSSAWTVLGVADWTLGLLDEAVAGFTTALETDPTSVPALNGRGQVLADLGRPQEALADLDETIANGDHLTAAYARSARALALFDLGRVEESLAEMTRAMAETPENGWAHLRLARIQEEQGRFADARLSAEAALAADEPALPEPLRRQAAELLARVGPAPDTPPG